MLTQLYSTLRKDERVGPCPLRLSSRMGLPQTRPWVKILARLLSRMPTTDEIKNERRQKKKKGGLGFGPKSHESRVLHVPKRSARLANLQVQRGGVERTTKRKGAKGEREMG